MPSLPNEIIQIILKHRRNISWCYHKHKVHQLLKNTILTTKISKPTNFDFRGYWITYYTGRNVEIIISQRPSWAVVSYVFMVPTPHPKQIGIETQKIVYCPMYHIE